jgi:hypothetical protein
MEQLTHDKQVSGSSPLVGSLFVAICRKTPWSKEVSTPSPKLTNCNPAKRHTWSNEGVMAHRIALNALLGGRYIEFIDSPETSLLLRSHPFVLGAAR